MKINLEKIKNERKNRWWRITDAMEIIKTLEIQELQLALFELVREGKIEEKMTMRGYQYRIPNE